MAGARSLPSIGDARSTAADRAPDSRPVHARPRRTASEIQVHTDSTAAKIIANHSSAGNSTAGTNTKKLRIRFAGVGPVRGAASAQNEPPRFTTWVPGLKPPNQTFQASSSWPSASTMCNVRDLVPVSYTRITVPRCSLMNERKFIQAIRGIRAKRRIAPSASPRGEFRRVEVAIGDVEQPFYRASKVWNQTDITLDTARGLSLCFLSDNRAGDRGVAGVDEGALDGGFPTPRAISNPGGDSMSFEMFPRTRVMLVDDHVLVRTSLRLLLQSSAQYEITYEASHGKDALAAVGERRPDVILLDIRMPQMDGLAALPQLIQLSPQSRIVMLTMHDESEYVRAAFQAGASGYVTKQSGPESLLSAVTTVLRGEVYVSPGCQQWVAGQEGAPAERQLLTARQREILTLIADGSTSKQIATQLGISVKTVESHRTAMMRSLDIHNLAGLVRYAVRVGLVAAGTEL